MWVKFLYYLTTETDIMDEWDFPRFQFKVIFERVSYIATIPRLVWIKKNMASY